MKFFSARHRPVHLGPYPLEKLVRRDDPWPLDAVPVDAPMRFERPGDPACLTNAMADFQAMLDVIRDGITNPARATIPDDLTVRADHLKAFATFNDADMVGIGPVGDAARKPDPLRNPAIDRLADDLRHRQTKTLASGIDVIMADLKDSIAHPPGPVDHHHTAIVIVTAYGRDPEPGEPGADWIQDAQAERACLRSAENATVIASYIRLLGYDARAQSGTTNEVYLGRLAIAAGLAVPAADGGAPEIPWLGQRYGLAVVTTDMPLAHDRPLAPMTDQPASLLRGLDWMLGRDGTRNRANRDPYRARRYMDGPHPFETLTRRDSPTTYIDEPNVPRVPKRADMFARAQFGELGPAVQAAAKGGHYARKTAPSSAQRRALGAFVLLQDGPVAQAPLPGTDDSVRNAENLKGASYFLGLDAVGLSRCPDWTWYSHDATGAEIVPPHDQALSMIVDQGFDTMEGASGDDWISVAQSMRAYLRFSLLGGVMARQVRNLGFPARAHTVMDGEVIQPPLLLLAGLGEVSRIGEVILNPFLGPRLKSGVVTMSLPVSHDKPIDFGLQRFCESCNKCARECPSGAITAGPKLMFNGYEIWKSDSQKCATYRITTKGGAMCGRCMKTCPWNLEGLFAEAPFRWAAMNMPAAAPLLARLDDRLGRGGLNDVKKWWWDIELDETGAYVPSTHPLNRRDLQRELDLKYEDQTLAVYPADLAPHPWPYPFPMDREAGIEAYQAMVTAEEYQARSAAGDTRHMHRRPDHDPATAPVVRVEITRARAMTDRITAYELRALDGGDLPDWTAGAHLDIVVAPEYLRQYSMSGDPADRSRYEIGVLREDEGRGGSALLHRIFTEGRKIFVSRPINHFELDPDAQHSLLMAGGIGITPMIAMAHSLHAAGRPFRLHYSVPSRAAAGYLDDLAGFAWADNVTLHVSDEGSRADLTGLFTGAAEGTHVYVCGPDRYIQGVLAAAEDAGLPEEARHFEYFAVPDLPDRPDHPFTLRLSRSGRDVPVAEGQRATEALAAAGIHVDEKCSDGICGVCQCGLVGGAVDHRDFVLSRAQRARRIILCQSRSEDPGGIVEIDL
ncbi:4Fe-4S double cluster binding domain-containing protein [Oceanomicrobium pacificus]|uniref:4Fe-4S dicluster domain-containing protein n=1 Tax=Oceanomicrobium pacificus TaxID=2692916 RepID=A0A6B0TU73_9RHOB|nr:4Fe-4S double cluster binding domain-containing protein [Oceanomicrobium pacificus]MXU65198.1 4Fe-4S dicluster domain-containing protein [Oceanomicrobium pacificus]